MMKKGYIFLIPPVLLILVLYGCLEREKPKKVSLNKRTSKDFLSDITGNP